jgi:hypothetical protein
MVRVRFLALEGRPEAEVQVGEAARHEGIAPITPTTPDTPGGRARQNQQKSGHEAFISTLRWFVAGPRVK